MGCDYWCKGLSFSQTKFQSTHPRGVRPRSWTSTLCRVLFQSTHPRGVRRLSFSQTKKELEISIHAPTWGATGGSAEAPTGASDFNPRTHVGCDSSGWAMRTSSGNFNPRTHVGCDPPDGSSPSGTKTISIHAPTWGATQV